MYAYGDIIIWGEKVAGASITSTPTIKGRVLDLPVISLAVGIETFYVFAGDGYVYSWGYNNYGSLGDGTAVTSSFRSAYGSIPLTGALSGKTITSLYAGNYLASVICTDGNMYVWGALYAQDWTTGTYTNYGIGAGTSVSTTTPTLVSIPGKQIKSISISMNDMMVQTTDASVYGFGENAYGQIGDGTLSAVTQLAKFNTSTFPSLTYDGEAVNLFVAGDQLNLITTTNGRAGILGRNNEGQLGIGYINTGTINSRKVFDIVLPGSGYSKMTTLNTAGSKSIATTDGCDYSPITTRNDSFVCPGSPPKLYAIGSNNVGQLGTSTTTNALVPTAVDMTGVLNNQYIVEVRSGLGFTVVLSTAGKLYSWGNNTAGTLGDNSMVAYNSTPTAIDTSASSALYMKTVVNVACGYTACFALTSTNELVYWGSICKGMIYFYSNNHSCQ